MYSRAHIHLERMQPKTHNGSKLAFIKVNSLLQDSSALAEEVVLINEENTFDAKNIQINEY